jgi:hypothetical protein
LNYPARFGTTKSKAFQTRRFETFAACELWLSAKWMDESFKESVCTLTLISRNLNWQPDFLSKKFTRRTEVANKSKTPADPAWRTFL